MKRPTPAQEAAARRDLKASGFRDLEVGPDRWLVRGAPEMTAELAVAGVYDAQAEYHRRARAFVHEHRWRWGSILDRNIWERHADGESVREIAEAAGCGRNHVQRTIERIRPLCFKPPSKRGRPTKPDRYGRDGFHVQARLDPEQTEALFALKTRLKLSHADVVRLAILWIHKFGDSFRDAPAR